MEGCLLQQLPSALHRKHGGKRAELGKHYEESQSELIDIIKVMASSVFRLRVNKIKTDMDLFDTIGKLTELQFLRLTLCKKDLVGDFSNNNMGIKLNELHQIASCLPVLKNLVTYS